MRRSESVSPYGWLTDEVRSIANDVDATSATFYVRDPFWPDELRLVGMHGVTVPEPMHGFSWPQSARRTITYGKDTLFIVSARGSKILREPAIDLSGLPAKRERLYKDFVGREGVSSAARLIKRDGAGQPLAVLFVNYADTTQFSKGLQRRIAAHFETLCKKLGSLRKAMTNVDAEVTLPLLATLISPSWSLANADFPRFNLDEYLSSIMLATLKALGLNDKNALGTIHLYDPERRELSLKASVGAINLARASAQSVNEGEGVVSWVVRRRRALLLKDLVHSAFYENIHIDINGKVKSELAAPLSFEGEVVGAICLESTKPDAFRPEHVRAVWCAANKVALTCRLNNYAEMSQRLLQVSVEAASREVGPSETLVHLSMLIATFAKASLCDIWQYDPELNQFGTRGANYDFFSGSAVRPDGWTSYVAANKCTLWIDDIKSIDDYRVVYWSSDVNDWSETPPASGVPKTLNQKPIEQKITAEVGIPILSKGVCLGVAWIKLIRPSPERPLRQRLELLTALMSEASVIIGCLEQKHVTEPEMQGVQRTAASLAQTLQASGPLDSELLDFACDTKAYRSKLGGDFCTARVLDNGSVGILLLDATSHGINGALQLLPMVGAYEATTRSESPDHEVRNLRKLTYRLSLTGSAMCATVSRIDGRTSVSVSSAGHPPIVRFRSEHGMPDEKHLPRRGSPGDSKMFHNVMTGPIGQDTDELFPGDILVGFTDGLFGQEDIDAAFDIIRRAVRRALTTNSVKAAAIVEGVFELAKAGPMLTDDVTVFAAVVKKYEAKKTEETVD
jgi:putative methionine-R-sulfoxide reductase with GAF domain